MISLTILEPYINKGICEPGYQGALAILGSKPRSVRELAEEYAMYEQENWLDVVIVAGVIAKDRAWIWQVARLAFGDFTRPLNRYSKTLSQANWESAESEAHESSEYGTYHAALCAYAANHYMTSPEGKGARPAAYTAYTARGKRQSVRDWILDIAITVIEQATKES